MVNIFGDSSGKVGPVGPPGPAGVGEGLKEVIRWFPQMILEQTRKKLNVLTLLIETVPPAKNADVELSSENTVICWKPFNEHKDYSLKPVDHSAELKSLMPPLNKKRYGLVFNKEQETMYYMEKLHTMFLSLNSAQVLLTITFLVGVKEDINDASDKEENSDEEEEEFILSDYRWTEYDKSAEKFRGVSTIPKANNKFDLYLHGAAARGKDDTHRLRIGVDLKNNLFYTLQVCWDGGEGSEGNGFYLLDKDGKPFIEKTSFQSNSVPDMMRPAFYLGGFNASTKHRQGVVKSKLFRGIISNMEIIHTRNTSIPEELLDFIRMNQTIINDDWSQVFDTAESGIEPPASKKKKIT